MASPLESHWADVKRILRYLSGTITHGFLLSPSPMCQNILLCAYSDSDWASDPDDRCSTSGTLISFPKHLLVWGPEEELCRSIVHFSTKKYHVLL